MLGTPSSKESRQAMFTFPLLIVGVILVAWVYSNRARNERWHYRPLRWCTNCFTVAQPLLRGNNEMYCPACQRIDPAPLESPAAQEFFRARQLAVPVQPTPRVLTPQERNFRLIAAFVVIAVTTGFGAFLDFVNRDSTHTPAVAAVQPAPKELAFTTDEFAALTQACGAPASLHDKAQPNGGDHGVQRDAKYKRLEFLFLRNNQDAWTLTGAFPIHADQVIDHERALKLMPCLAKVHFQIGLRDDQ